MQSAPFNIQTDLAPVPFTRKVCEMAAQLKEAGLAWKPHVGCFAWDRDRNIQVPSPFPERIYFILNLRRFLDIFDSIEEISRKLIWIPTWHQAQLLCDLMGVKKRDVIDILCQKTSTSADEILVRLYTVLLRKLRNELP